MKKTNIIILILLIILAGTLIAFLNNKNNGTDIIDKKGLANTRKDFSFDIDNCDKVKNIFDTIPHLTTYKDYDLQSVNCADTGVMVRYNNPAGSSYDMRAILKKEANQNKFIHNVGVAGHDVEEVIETIASDMNNLKRFENTTVTIKNNSEYADVSYVTTYKKEYVLTINVRGTGLTDKAKVETYLGEYLESFDLSKLQ